MRLLLTVAAAVATLVAAPFAGPSGAANGSVPGLGPRLRVVASYPRTGDDGLLTDPVAIRFNHPVDPATITASSVHMEVSGAPVQGAATAGLDSRGRPDPRIVLWRPQSPLHPSGNFRLSITREVRSLPGRELEDPFTVTFATSGSKNPAVAADLDPSVRLRRAPHLGPAPRVRFTFPQAGLGNVYTDEVTIRFSQAMDADAFVGGTFSVRQAEASLPGSITFPEDWAGKEIRFLPDKPLYRDTTFQMVVTRDARTMRGRYLREDYRAGFGTSPFKGGIKPIRAEDFDDTSAPDLPVGRAFHTVTALPGGDLVVAGGQDLGGAPLASCFVYRAAGGSFVAAAPMHTARRKHCAVPTRDGGVMVVGGYGPGGTALPSVEVYSPVTDAWTVIAPTSVGRTSFTATVVSGSRVLVVGGYTTDGGSFTYADGAEIFTPSTGAWTSTAGPPVSRRGGHTATLLPDGRVLLAGGTPGLSLLDEVYDPSTGAFTATSPPMEYRVFHAACLTKTGGVLLAGGGPGRAEVFDPSTMSFREAGFCPPFQLPVAAAPAFATLTLIPGGGRVALIGGLVPGGSADGSDLVLDQVQLWDPAGNQGTGAFYPMLFDLKTPRAAHTVNLLPDGGFILIGGLGTNGVTNESAVTIFRPSQ